MAAVVKEVYGKEDAKYTIKVANGGAGPTGIIRAFAEAFLSTRTPKERDHYNIGWIQSVSYDSLQHVKHHRAEIALTYEPLLEQDLINDKTAENYAYIFKDHFWIVGPKEGVDHIIQPVKEQAKRDTIISQLQKIAEVGKQLEKPVFITRDDNSGTVTKELSLWEAACIDLPSEIASTTNWYHRMTPSAPRFPADCLRLAQEMKCFTIIDRGTFLNDPEAQKNMKIFLQGSDDDDDLLLNPCHATVSTAQDHVKKMAVEFVQFMAGKEGQKIAKGFGVDKPTNLWKEPLYTPANPSLLVDTPKAVKKEQDDLSNYVKFGIVAAVILGFAYFQRRQ